MLAVTPYPTYLLLEFAQIYYVEISIRRAPKSFLRYIMGDRRSFLS